MRECSERQVRRTRPKVIASCRAWEWVPKAVGRGFLPREITCSRDHLRPSAANFTRVCMPAFALRCVYYFTRRGHANWRLERLQLLLACGWWAGRGKEYRWRKAQRSRAQPRWGPGAKPRRGGLNELKMFHEQILSRNVSWFVKIRKQMTIEKKNNKMILSASAFNSCMIEFSIPDFNETIIKNIISLFLSFSNTERRKLCSVRNGSSVSTAVNERGEGIVVAVRAYLCRCTSFPFYDGLLRLHSTDAR